MNKEWIRESILQIWSKPYRVEHLLEVVVANKVVEVVFVAKIKEDTTTSMTKVEIVTQILLKEGTALLDLKISHIYNVFDEKKKWTL